MSIEANGEGLILREMTWNEVLDFIAIPNGWKEIPYEGLVEIPEVVDYAKQFIQEATGSIRIIFVSAPYVTGKRKHTVDEVEFFATNIFVHPTLLPIHPENTSN